jgi:hypothetical protein
MGRACSMDWDKRNAYRILVGKPKGKRPLERPQHKMMDNINLRKTTWGGVDLIYLVLDRDQCRAFVNMVMNLWFPLHFWDKSS